MMSKAEIPLIPHIYYSQSTCQILSWAFFPFLNSPLEWKSQLYELLKTIIYVCLSSDPSEGQGHRVDVQILCGIYLIFTWLKLKLLLWNPLINLF